MDALGNILYVNFLGYAHWFISIIISHIKDHYISVDQDRYATSVVSKYLDPVTVKRSTKYYNTTLPYDMIFTKANSSTSDEKVEKLTNNSKCTLPGFDENFANLCTEKLKPTLVDNK